MGCVTQVGEQGWNVGRMARARRGLARDRLRDDRRPAVRLLDADELQRGRRRPAGPARRRRLGGGRDDVARPDGLERRRHLGPAARALADRAAGDLGRGDRRGVEDLARGARRVLARVAPARDRRERRRAASSARSCRSRSRARAARRARSFAVDETPRRDTSARSSPRSLPAFLPDGMVTAGNSSQICDGAAAVLIASEEAATRLGLEPRGRFVSFGLSGVDPHRMLHGNPRGVREGARARPGSRWDDIAVIEVNEAFASVALQFMRDTGLERALGGRQPERRRDLARPSARRDRRADDGDAAERARAPRRALRRRVACASASGMAIAGVIERF